MFERINRPILQLQQLQSISQPAIDIAHQMESLHLKLAPFFTEIRLAQESISPAVESILRTQAIMNNDIANLAASVKESARFQIEQWESTLEMIANISVPNIEIPNIIYPRIQELASSIVDIIPEEFKADAIPQTPSEKTDKPLITWQDLLNFLIFVLSVFQVIQGMQDNVNDQKHNQEILIEMKKQTELQEKQLEIEQQRLELDKEQVQKYGHLEKELNDLLETIKPLIPENLNDLEDDGKNPESVD